MDKLSVYITINVEGSESSCSDENEQKPNQAAIQQVPQEDPQCEIKAEKGESQQELVAVD